MSNSKALELCDPDMVVYMRNKVYDTFALTD